MQLEKKPTTDKPPGRIGVATDSIVTPMRLWHSVAISAEENRGGWRSFRHDFWTQVHSPGMRVRRYFHRKISPGSGGILFRDRPVGRDSDRPSVRFQTPGCLTPPAAARTIPSASVSLFESGNGSRAAPSLGACSRPGRIDSCIVTGRFSGATGCLSASANGLKIVEPEHYALTMH